MDIYSLEPGDKVRTTDGALVEILRETEDGQWILIRYLEDPKNPSVIGTEDLCHRDELKELFGVTRAGLSGSAGRQAWERTDVPYLRWNSNSWLV